MKQELFGVDLTISRAGQAAQAEACSSKSRGIVKANRPVDWGKQFQGGASPAPTIDDAQPLNQFQVAFAIPIGHSFVVFAHFPAPRGHKMLHEIGAEILFGQFALLEQVDRCCQIAR